jgi:hypothetical protein
MVTIMSRIRWSVDAETPREDAAFPLFYTKGLRLTHVIVWSKWRGFADLGKTETRKGKMPPAKRKRKTNDSEDEYGSDGSFVVDGKRSYFFFRMCQSSHLLL